MLLSTPVETSIAPPMIRHQYSRPSRSRLHSLRCLLATLWLAVIVCVFNTAQALEFRCELDADIRYLTVDIPGQERLCEVGVLYLTSGERRVMWYANNDTLFCSAKAYELRDKYENEWGFACHPGPDIDGIDKLSPTHRTILDTRLKSLIERGERASPEFTVTAIRATASTPLDGMPSALALQYFLSNGDVTEVILDEGGSWEVFATIENLASRISGDVAVDTAMIDSITDSGALEISTTINTDDNQQCFGTQVLIVEPSNRTQARTSHRYLCNPRESVLNDTN